MLCRKCKKEIPDGSKYCNFCAALQNKPARKPKRRGNGQGTAYKVGSKYQCEVVIGYDPVTKKPLRRTKGGFNTKSDALAYIPILRQTVIKTSNDITLMGLFDKWQPWYEPRVGKSTMGGYKAAFQHYKDIWFAKFSDLSTDDFQECVDNCIRGKRTKEDMKSLAMQLYKYGASIKIADHNYAQYIFCGRGQEGTRPSFTTEEIETIRRAIGILPYADYTYCLIYTGFRPNEMFQLEKKDYDIKHDCLIGGFKTEAGTDRIIPISPKIKEIMQGLIKSADPYIFPREDGSLMTDAYFREKCFYPLMDRLGIKDRVPYSTRHAFSNLLKNVEGSDTDKAALMGHADASMTKQYQSPDYKSLKEIMDKI